MTINMNHSINGYHGTARDNLFSILEDGFVVSVNDYDWLGDGVYFFQDAPIRALMWAKERYGDDAAVIGADIKIDNCIDLLDTGWSEFLADVYDKYLERIKKEGITLPKQSSGAHRLDREVLNYAVSVLEQKGVVVKSIRAAFIEGSPIFPNSALFAKSHVQLAVRDLTAITKTWEETAFVETPND